MRKRIFCLFTAVMLTVTMIPSLAFAAGTTDYKEIPAEKLTYEINEDGTVTITAVEAYEIGNAIIPETINGKKVTALGPELFANLYVTGLIIPESVTEIGEYAFRDCNALEKVEIRGDMDVIGNNAFYYCIALKEVVLPDTLVEISKGLFFNCESLEYVSIPKGVTVVGRSAFSGCESLKELSFAEGLNEIGEYAFAYCDGLKTVELPESVNEIDHLAFYALRGKPIIVCHKDSYVHYFCWDRSFRLHVIGCEHSFTEPEVEKESTCSQKGEKVEMCYKCGHTNVEELELLPHTEHIIQGGKPTCGLEGLTDEVVCDKCGIIIKEQEVIPPTGEHVFAEYSVPKKATFTESGKRVYDCKICQTGTKMEIIPAVVAPKLSQKTYVFNNTAKTPKVTIKGLESSQYTVKYPNSRKRVGSYEVTVTLKDHQYKGSKKLYFTINPKGLNISKLTKGKKQITVKWVKQAKMHLNQIDGYQIRYSTNANMKNAKTVKVGKYATKKVIKNLKANKKYYVQIRAYEESGLSKYYSTWSKTKSVRTK